MCVCVCVCVCVPPPNGNPSDQQINRGAEAGLLLSAAAACSREGASAFSCLLQSHKKPKLLLDILHLLLFSPPCVFQPLSGCVLCCHVPLLPPCQTSPSPPHLSSPASSSIFLSSSSSSSRNSAGFHKWQQTCMLFPEMSRGSRGVRQIKAQSRQSTCSFLRRRRRLILTSRVFIPNEKRKQSRSVFLHASSHVGTLLSRLLQKQGLD